MMRDPEKMPEHPRPAIALPKIRVDEFGAAPQIREPISNSPEENISESVLTLEQLVTYRLPPGKSFSNKSTNRTFHTEAERHTR